MKFSQHAQQQAQQRIINPLAIELIVAFGDDIRT